MGYLLSPSLRYAYTEGTVNPEVGVHTVEMPMLPGQPPVALEIGDRIQTLRREREHYLELLNQALQA